MAASPIDSLRAEVPRLQGKEKLKAMRNLFQLAVQKNDEQLQYQFADELRREAFKQKDDSTASFAWFSKIASLYNYGHRDHLRDSITPYMKYTESIGRWDHYYYAWSLMCNVYFFKGQYFMALREAEAIHRDAERRHSEVGLAWAYKQLGQVYLSIEATAQAVEYSKKAIELMQRQEKPEWSGISTVYNRYCNALERDKDKRRLNAVVKEWSETLDKWEDDLKKQGLSTTAVLLHRMHWAKYQLGILVDEKRYDDAKRLLDHCDSISNHLSSISKAQLYQMQSIYYEKVNEPQKSLEAVLNRVDFYQRLGHGRGSPGDMLNLAHSYLVAGYPEKAAELYAYAIPKKDSVNNESMKSQLNEMSTLYELDEKTAEARRKAQEQKIKIRSIAATGALLITLVLLVYYLNRRQMLRRLKEKRAELEKANDDLRKANSRALEAARMKETFISHMGYEVKEPLSIITGFTQLISTPQLTMSDDERTGILDSIGKATDQITGTVNQLLELSNIESVEQFEMCETISCRKLCLDAIEEAKIASTDDVAFRFKPLIDNSVKITTNRRHAVTMLAYLLINAKIHTKQGSITMTCLKTSDDKEMMVAVEDTGNGLPERLKDCIFDPIALPTDNSDTTHLSLCVCHRTAQRLGGKLELEHSGEDGTRFVARLPFNEEKEK